MEATKIKERNDLLKTVGFSDDFIEKLNNYDKSVFETSSKDFEELNQTIETINNSHDLLISEKSYLPSYQIKIDIK